MEFWQDDILLRFQRASTEQELFEAVKVEAQRIGFDHCAYVLRLPLRLSEPKTVMLSTYPLEWQQRYISEGYQAVDPIVLYGSKSLIPLVWTEDMFCNAEELGEDTPARGFATDGPSRLCHGWTQSCIDMRGIRGMLTLIRSAEPLSDDELREHGYRMVWLAQIVHQCMCNLISKHMLPETTIHLTAREKEVLRWTAEGKTSGEIAKIISLAERTVNFHIARSMAKLNCVNKTSVTVKAALLGLLI
jgi:LuxR family quorum-sensing system transcriptional regulator SolR